MKSSIKSTLITALVVTSYISFILVGVNSGITSDFLVVWLRSWGIAYILAVPSLLYVAPIIQKKINP